MDNDLLIPAYNPETMETHLPGLYLAGVVCGGLNTHIWFIENSRIHAEMIVNNITAKKWVDIELIKWMVAISRLHKARQTKSFIK